jgi:hypothetical protein
MFGEVFAQVSTLDSMVAGKSPGRTSQAPVTNETK